MEKYLVKFKLDIEDNIDYDDCLDLDIEEIDDSEFIELLNNIDGAKEFENWYNEDESNNEKISVVSIKYSTKYDDSCEVEVVLKDELQDKDYFANALVEYMFDLNAIKVIYRVTGSEGVDNWDYNDGNYSERSEDIDYTDTCDISSYSNVTIEKI